MTVRPATNSPGWPGCRTTRWHRLRRVHPSRPGNGQGARPGRGRRRPVASHRAERRGLSAERRGGELLGEMPRASKTDNLKRGPKSHDVTSGPELADLGITKMQSSRWQAAACCRSRTQAGRVIHKRGAGPTSKLIPGASPALHRHLAGPVMSHKSLFVNGPGGIRTHTGAILSRVPLPLGYGADGCRFSLTPQGEATTGDADTRQARWRCVRWFGIR